MLVVWAPIAAALRIDTKVLLIVFKGPVCKINKVFKEACLTDHLIFGALQVSFLKSAAQDGS